MFGLEVFGLAILALLFTAAQFCWLLEAAKAQARERPLRQSFGSRYGVVIRCPTTWREFSTDIQVDAETLARVPQELTHTHCPYCKAQHSWLPLEAKLVDAIPPGDWIENQNSR
jgi:hypothetical protein